MNDEKLDKHNATHENRSSEGEPAARDKSEKQAEEMSTVETADTPAPTTQRSAHDSRQTEKTPLRPVQNSGVLVLQWLSYAFWLWFHIATAVLVGMVINYHVSSSNADVWGSQMAYPLAAVMIMLAIALVTDYFYTRFEPEKKTGGANVIMLLHIVPFILIAIGALVTIVFSLLTMLLNSDPLATIDGPLQVMVVAFVVAVLFGLLAARLFFGNRRHMRKIAWAVFVATALVAMTASVVGPVMTTMRTKNDRLIERTLPSLAIDIRNYAREHDALPKTLSDVTHDDGEDKKAVQKLIDERLVEYKPNTEPARDGNVLSPGDTNDDSVLEPMIVRPGTSGHVNPTRFYYQLCTTYMQERKDKYTYSEPEPYDGTSAGVSISEADAMYRNNVPRVTSHPAGKVCYNLYADGKYPNNVRPRY